MKKILSLILCVLIVSCAHTANYRESPLAAMIGKWASTEEECNTYWVEFSLSEDKNKQILNYSDGRESSAKIKSVSPGMFHLQYQNERRIGDDGELFSWWFIFENNNKYRMRRNDWLLTARTQGSWLRCS